MTPATNGLTFLWNDGSTGEHQNIVAKDLGIGTFPIWAMAMNNEHCYVKDSMLLTIDISDVIEMENHFSMASVYPNPVKNGFYLDLEEHEIIEFISLYGNTGQIYLNTKPFTYPYFDVSYLAPGLYVLKLKTNKQSAVFQIIKY
ncbi:MAG TPA: T9SS type A sorting domain-containing protein [Prolixibacteraceae bacterium]|nr:T9SS type A sorting domain-containing protein [Prolixibacteraceae bacterium]